jgi:hypothetical protein
MAKQQDPKKIAKDGGKKCSMMLLILVSTLEMPRMNFIIATQEKHLVKNTVIKIEHKLNVKTAKSKTINTINFNHVSKFNH